MHVPRLNSFSTTLLPNQTITPTKESPINRLHTPTETTNPMARTDRFALSPLTLSSPVRPHIQSSRDVRNSWRPPSEETRHAYVQRPTQRDTLQEGEGGMAEDAHLPAARKRKVSECPDEQRDGEEINAGRKKWACMGERGEGQGRQPGHAVAAEEGQSHASATPPCVEKRKRKHLNLETHAGESDDAAAVRMAKRRRVHETEQRVEMVTIRIVTEKQQSDASDSRSATPEPVPDLVGEEDDRVHRAGNRGGGHPDVLRNGQDSMRVAAVQQAGVGEATDAGRESPQRHQKSARIVLAGHVDRPQRSALTTQRTASITTSSRTVTEAKYTVERLLRFSGSGRDRIWLVKWRDFTLPTWQSEEILVEDLEDGGHWQRLTHAFAG